VDSGNDSKQLLDAVAISSPGETAREQSDRLAGNPIVGGQSALDGPTSEDSKSVSAADGASSGQRASNIESAQAVVPASLDTANDFSLNYFNYMTEIEEEFVRRRGSHLLISPMDWAMVESWRDAGVPLHIVMRGISKAFDGYEARGNHFRKVNSVLYCQQAVEESYAEYRLSLVGEATGQPVSEGQANQELTSGKKARKQAPGFAKEAVIEFIDRCQREILEAASRAKGTGDQPSSQQQGSTESPFKEAQESLLSAHARLSEINKALQSTPDIDAESLELDLDAIDRMLLDKLKEACGVRKVEELTREAETQLKKYRKKMDKELYQQTVDNFVARRVRELGHIPRLSLFYMS
jgi:hypothetical protein